MGILGDVRVGQRRAQRFDHGVERKLLPFRVPDRDVVAAVAIDRQRNADQIAAIWSVLVVSTSKAMPCAAIKRIHQRASPASSCTMIVGTERLAGFSGQLHAVRRHIEQRHLLRRRVHGNARQAG